MPDSTLRPAAPVPSVWELFVAFSGVALIGFGGVMPFIYRMVVERRRWMDAREFSEALAVAQFLPGGNVMNLAVAIGQRHHGVLGALSAVAGLIAGPFVLVTAVALLFLRYGQAPMVHGLLGGIAAAAAGLMIATSAKLARPLFARTAIVPILLAIATFAAVAVLELPLLLVLALLVPIGVAHAWWSLP